MKKNMKKKVITMMAVLIFLFDTTITSHAAEPADSVPGTSLIVVSEQGTSSCQVSISQSGYFTVNIPNTITLQGGLGKENSCEYFLMVRGDLPADTLVAVSPDASFSMTDTLGCKDPLTATVTQSKVYYTAGAFTYNSTYTATNTVRGIENPMGGASSLGKVQVADMTAGSFTGTFQFHISVLKKE